MTSQSHMNQEIDDERDQEARKIVQIAAVPDTESTRSAVLALDNRGDVWVASNGADGWEKLPPLPES